jgi:AbrB family transcriptional regulator (stage V sporulation protein T)
MKGSGIIRRIDDLGRVVLPREIRQVMKLHEGDPVEMFFDKQGQLVLRKHSHTVELTDFAKEYAYSLYETTGHIALITDTDQVIAVAGTPKTEYLKNISVLDELKDNFQAVISSSNRKARLFDKEKYQQVFAPIVNSEATIGAVILIAKTPKTEMGKTEMSIAEVAAEFLAIQAGGES